MSAAHVPILIILERGRPPPCRAPHPRWVASFEPLPLANGRFKPPFLPLLLPATVPPALETVNGTVFDEDFAPSNTS